MKGMIFAAGVGSRLKPWTDYHPKALVEVGGTPMLGRVIMRMKEIGIRKVVVNVHHFAEQIEDYLRSCSNFGIDIRVSDERGELLDTGGGLLKASEYLEGNEPILLHNADIYCNVDLHSMAKCHEECSADATLLVARRKTSRVLLFDDSCRLRGWKNLTTGATLPEMTDCGEELHQRAFNGVHIISPAILRELRHYSDDNVFSITPFYAENSSKLNILGYEAATSYTWVDVGRIESLEKACEIAGHN